VCTIFRCQYPTLDDSDRIAATEAALTALTPDTLLQTLQDIDAAEEAAAEAAKVKAEEERSSAEADGNDDSSKSKKGGNRQKGGSKKGPKPRKKPTIKDLLLRPACPFSMYGPDCVSHVLVASEVRPLPTRPCR